MSDHFTARVGIRIDSDDLALIENAARHHHTTLDNYLEHLVAAWAIRKREELRRATPPRHPRDSRTRRRLGQRERTQLAEMLAQGISLSEIGRRLGISHTTVIYHRDKARRAAQ